MASLRSLRCLQPYMLPPLPRAHARAVLIFTSVSSSRTIEADVDCPASTSTVLNRMKAITHRPAHEIADLVTVVTDSTTAILCEYLSSCSVGTSRDGARLLGFAIFTSVPAQAALP